MKTISAKHIISLALFYLLTIVNGSVLLAEDKTPLPLLSDPLSGIISLDQEMVLGQTLLRQVRAQLPIVNDPLSNDYLKSISYKLAENSELQIKELNTLIVLDNSINAFAMPGNIVATNSGLFQHAETEAEFAAVLAHELAHLSQRHFARMIAEQQNQKLTTLGAYLASVLVLLTVGTEPGIGALAATNAAAQQSALRFSRKNEQEADRIGMQTLVKAEMDPEAMASFFIKLQQDSQFSGQQAPEYMLSHPVTESRIADARTRSDKYSRKRYEDNINFHLIKNRLAVIETQNLRKLVEQLEQAASKASGVSGIGTKYGLSIAYTETKQFKKAKSLIESLQKDDQHRIAYYLADAELSFEQDKFEEAIAILEPALELHPENYPLSILYAECLIRNKDIGEAVYLLESLSLKHKSEPYVWRRLAEAHGLKGNRLSVYLAKAEYFHLYGLHTQALSQLEFALPLAKDNYQLKSKIESRIKSIKEEQKEISL